jgi:hypothetical protein
LTSGFFVVVVPVTGLTGVVGALPGFLGALSATLIALIAIIAITLPFAAGPAGFLVSTPVLTVPLTTIVVPVPGTFLPGTATLGVEVAVFVTFSS